MSERLPLAGIDVAILVGGLGKRLREVVSDVPKPFAPVFGRPFIFYVLDMLALRGAGSVTLCSGHLAEHVRKMTGNEWLGMPIRHSVEQTAMGTGGALALAKNFLNSRHALVMNGDTWLEPDFGEFLATAAEGDFCLCGVKVADAGRYGTLEIDGARHVHAFREKSGSSTEGLINGGCYLISREIIQSLPEEQMSLETNVLPELSAEGRVTVFETSAPFLDIGIPDDYAKAEDFFCRLSIAPDAMFSDFPDMQQAAVKLGTCVVIFDEQKRVLLERRVDCGWWGLPGGRVDPGERVLAGALREAQEETGLAVQVDKFLGVFSDPRRRTVRYPDNGDIRQLVDIAVVAKPVGGVLNKSGESSDLRWFSPHQIPLDTVPPAVEILRGAYSDDLSPRVS